MPKVYVMMSGGVDSSVAAAVLKERGYDLIGVFMRCWSLDMLRSMGLSEDLYGCFWEDDLQDASLVAKKLNIPFEAWDFEEEYKKRIIDYMINGYKQGITPNPDVMCNGLIKFGIFYEQAMARGADYVATGHYAKILGDTKIGRGKDSNKDQSYFLWQIKKEQVPHIFFPVGEFNTKAEVRAAAERFGLLTADKPDSQGLCFIGDTPLREMLLQTLGQKQGDIVDVNTRKVLGKHPGAFLYTIGQREKLGLSGGPWFVSRIDVNQNIVFVAHQDNQSTLYKNKVMCYNLNWIVEPQNSSLDCEAQVRYRQLAQKCSLKMLANGQAEVTFNEAVRAIASGQSIVFYDGDLVLGGGVIL